MAVGVKFSGEIGGLKLSALKFSLEFGIWNLEVEIPKFPNSILPEVLQLDGSEFLRFLRRFDYFLLFTAH